MNTITITPKLLKQLMPNITNKNAEEYAIHLPPALDIAEINTPERLAMFVAQVGHESGSLNLREEIWLNSPSQKRYDPPSELSKKLGNIKEGDGYRYRGRGIIQLTGRANYRVYGKLLNIDLEEHPHLASLPENSTKIAAHYWKRNHLNEPSDQLDIIKTTKRINGGIRGLEDRIKRYKHACSVLEVKLPEDFPYHL